MWMMSSAFTKSNSINFSLIPNLIFSFTKIWWTIDDTFHTHPLMPTPHIPTRSISEQYCRTCLNYVFDFLRPHPQIINGRPLSEAVAGGLISMSRCFLLKSGSHRKKTLWNCSFGMTMIKVLRQVLMSYRSDQSWLGWHKTFLSVVWANFGPSWPR